MVVEKNNSYGVPVNGTWNGMRGHLQRGVNNMINLILLYCLLQIIIHPGCGFGLRCFCWCSGS